MVRSGATTWRRLRRSRLHRMPPAPGKAHSIVTRRLRGSSSHARIRPLQYSLHRLLADRLGDDVVAVLDTLHLAGINARTGLLTRFIRPLRAGVVSNSKACNRLHDITAWQIWTSRVRLCRALRQVSAFSDDYPTSLRMVWEALTPANQ